MGQFLIVAFFIIAMILAMRHTKANHDALMVKLKTAADHFGLKFVDPKNDQAPELKSNLMLGIMALTTKNIWSIEGTFQEVIFCIKPKTKRVGVGRNRHNVVYTEIRASFARPLNAGLHIYREGFFSKIGKIFGDKDIETGNADFDKQFILKGNNEAILIPLLSNPSVQQAVIALFNLGDQVEFDDEGITMECKKIVQTVEDYEPRLRLISDTIKSFTK